MILNIKSYFEIGHEHTNIKNNQPTSFTPIFLLFNYFTARGKNGGIWLSGYFNEKRWWWKLSETLLKELEYTNWGLTQPTSGCISLRLSNMKWRAVGCGFRSSNYVVCERKEKRKRREEKRENQYCYKQMHTKKLSVLASVAN